MVCVDGMAVMLRVAGLSRRSNDEVVFVLYLAERVVLA